MPAMDGRLTRMEPLQLALMIVCSILSGSIVAVIWIYAQMRAHHLALVSELAKVKADFADTVLKTADVSNGWASKFMAMSDQLMAHDMILKGSKRA